ncbi:hypothetical protein NEMIN01_1229 [Nematocida minor]|uniref:uncharacterized protein n=1 Tax=Nematocida minor TaxID=1912983 RepID=UPI00221E6FBC|nr:uncharacterized protein NEMIN01_1229 [Nematocida minor]KAI5190827.1 hypothetical protein NEMIN01_1229 [Nematocida minor]
MLMYSYASLCEVFQDSNAHFKTGENGLVKTYDYSQMVKLVVLERLDSSALCVMDAPEKENSEDSTALGRVVCSICENGKVTIAKYNETFFIITDFMNTVPVRLSCGEGKNYPNIEIGREDVCNSSKKKVNKAETEVSEQREKYTLGQSEAIQLERENAHIITKECHHRHICAGEKSSLCTYRDSVYQLEHLLYHSLISLVKEKNIFISFSGGIDSFLCATLCCKYFRDRSVYLINTSFSKDGAFVSRDRKAAHAFYGKIVSAYGENCFLVENNISRAEVLEKQDEIAGITRNTTMDFNLAALHYFTAKKAKSLGASSIVTGTGGDELFLGYSRHREAVAGGKDVHSSSVLDKKLQEMVCTDVKTFWKTNLHRDYSAGSMCSISLVSPFLDPLVFEYAIESADHRKVEKKELTDILHREYPGIQLKKKLAGQYGSGIADVIRSIRCRAHTLCRNNECLSLECSKTN